jgi:hypothetical protein
MQFAVIIRVLGLVFGALSALPIFSKILRDQGGLPGVVSSVAGAVYGPVEQAQPGKTVAGPAGGGGATPAVPAVPLPSSESSPPFGVIVKDVVNNPWGLAALGFVGVFVIAQLRGAARDVGDGVKQTTQALSNPESAVKVK